MVFATHFGPDAFKQHGLTPTRCLFATYDSTSANCVDGLLDGLSKDSTRCRWWISTSSTKNATFHPDPTISKHMASPRNKPELPKILVADDDRWLLESMADWLSGIGYQVQTASNIEQAKKACAHGKYDLMLCDVRFEDGDGLTLLKRIRSKHPTLPVIMMTGYAGPDAACEAIAAGAFDFLTKPIIDQELQTAIERALHQQEIAEENLRALATPLLFHGHTHIPALWSLQDGVAHATHVDTEAIALRAGSLVNAGSVGQPRDHDPRAAWLLWERDELGAGLGTVTWRRVEYNIPAAQEAIDAAGLPDFLASRLAIGR